MLSTDGTKRGVETSTEDVVGSTGAEADTISEIHKGRIDSRGEPIDGVYFKRPLYAVYRSGSQIVVAFADDTQIATEQLAAVGPLLPLRDHLINITKELPKSGSTENYLNQIAEALRLGLEGQLDIAKSIINEAMADALAAQARIGRMFYLMWAGGIALSFASAIMLVSFFLFDEKSDFPRLLLATGAGAVGALLSISIAIRSRTVAVDGNWRANAIDAAVRLLIGVISAAVLFLLLSSGLLADITVGAVSFAGGTVKWQAVLIIGFVAGFLERLVPDLLEKSASEASPNARPPTSSSGVATPNTTAIGHA